MIIEDHCEQVRYVCSKSLAMVIHQIDDESRLSEVKKSLYLDNIKISFIV